VRAAAAILAPVQTTVGTATRIDHRRATAVGSSVEITATPPRNAGSSHLTFEVRVVDRSGQVDSAGPIDRAIVDRKRFLEAAHAIGGSLISLWRPPWAPTANRKSAARYHAVTALIIVVRREPVAELLIPGSASSTRPPTATGSGLVLRRRPLRTAARPRLRALAERGTHPATTKTILCRKAST